MAEPKPCGTRAAYKRHLRRYEQPCPACREAAAQYTRQQRAAQNQAPAGTTPGGTMLGLAGMPISEAVGVALGAVSVCWETPAGAGGFDSVTASRIADELLERISREVTGGTA